MSTLKVNNLQVGQHATATNNFTLYQPAVPDGTVRLGYGNVGSVTDSLTFTNTGRLGIGTTNPSAKFHVFGNARIDGSTNPYLVLNDGTNTGYLQIASGNLDLYHNNNITFSPGTSQKVIINSSGNVGIGVTNPDSLLHLKSTTGNVRHTIEVPDTFQAFTNYSAANSEFSIGYIRNSGSDHSFRFCAADGLSSGEILRIDSVNQRVGIGVTNPSARLDVESNSASGYIAEFNQSNTSNSAQLLINSPTNGESRPVLIDMSRAGVLQWSIGQAYLDTNNSFHIANSTLQSGNTGSKLCITSSGKVGIGNNNTSPDSILHVKGDINLNITKLAHFESNDSSPGAVPLVKITRADNLTSPVSEDNAALFITDHISNFPLHIENHTGSNLFTVNGNGNVGIGTTNPQTTLDVRGSTTIIGSASTAVTKVYSYNSQPATGHTPGVYTFARHIPVVSSGNQLRIPIPYQANYNSHTLMRVRGTSAIYNTRDSLYFDVSIGIGYLTVISNFTTYQQSGNISSITTTTGTSGSNPHYININFTTAYTGATSNGINLWLEYFTAVEGYSIDVANIVMN